MDGATLCAREPIHIPGSIQPHGCLFALDGDRKVVQASANLAQWVGMQARQVLGCSLADWWPEAAALLNSQPGRCAEQPDVLPNHLGDLRAPDGGALLAMLVHTSGPYDVVELELADDRQRVLDTIYPLARGFLAQLQRIQSVSAMCELAVAEIKRITGFGRVLAYCFDAEGHGSVISERVDTGYPSYAGLRFPASDIPAQARALYVRNRIRVIHDANYEPVPLVPALPVGSELPLDMSHAALRSVSPVHVKYMKNMGTLASMSMSIVINDELWGLISCHDAQARDVPLRVRTACELIAGMLSMQIDARVQQDRMAARYALRRDIVEMLTAMAERDNVMAGLRDVDTMFVSFVRGDGAAVVAGSRCESYGHTPERADILQFCQWLQESGGRNVFHSDSLQRDVPHLPRLADSSAGVMAVPISSLHAHYLVWFRNERVHEVNWAGAPRDKIDPQSGALSPRNSFSCWREIVSGSSAPWDAVQIEAARELGHAVLGLVLRKAEERAALAADLAETNKELEAFSYSVSHDLRAPLRHIAGFAELLGELEGQNMSERGHHFLANIRGSAQLAGTLVDDLLNFSQMGRAALRYTDVDIGALVRDIRREMSPELEGRHVDWHVQQDMPSMRADAAFIRLVLRNLLSNAVKYSRGRETAVVSVGARHDGEGIVVDIQDNGAGFDMAYVDKLFGIFQRLHRMEDFEGTGIGLASVRRVVERHNGRVWAHGELGKGATFSFWIPDRPPSE
ncbi:GAF domain-containing protein [Verticiella sediminum]|uniref:histidine kinase n=2 Tax=Verticiella sediminum TaxID=1247510 RepID=A0A556AZ04_9BURK|nr:GAF domain-containing protein [Verticiella sediminum]